MFKMTANTGIPVTALLFVPAGFINPVFADGEIYFDPAHPAEGFKPHELPFATPAGGVARDEFKSQEFYAIILKSAEPCGIREEERLQAQTLFPQNKVFASRFQCDDDIEENIRYTNVNGKYALMAVYAGDTLEKAKQFLAEVTATGKYPGANIRKMGAVLVYP